MLIDEALRSYISLRLFIDDVCTQAFPSWANAGDRQTAPQSALEAENSVPNVPVLNKRASTVQAPARPIPDGHMADIDRLEQELFQLKQLAASVGGEEEKSKQDLHKHHGVDVLLHLSEQRNTERRAAVEQPSLPVNSKRRTTLVDGPKSSPTPPAFPATEVKVSKRGGFGELLADSAPVDAAAPVLMDASVFTSPMQRSSRKAAKATGERTRVAPLVDRDGVRKPVAEYSSDEVAIALLSRFGSA